MSFTCCGCGYNEMPEEESRRCCNNNHITCHICMYIGIKTAVGNKVNYECPNRSIDCEADVSEYVFDTFIGEPHLKRTYFSICANNTLFETITADMPLDHACELHKLIDELNQSNIDLYVRIDNYKRTSMSEMNTRKENLDNYNDDIKDREKNVKEREDKFRALSNANINLENIINLEINEKIINLNLRENTIATREIELLERESNRLD